MNIRIEGAYFKQTKLIRPNNNNVINIYIVYLIAPISNTRNTDYTVQNALFGGVKIIKNATDISKHKYEDMEYVLMKEVHLVKEILVMEEMH